MRIFLLIAMSLCGSSFALAAPRYIYTCYLPYTKEDGTLSSKYFARGDNSFEVKRESRNECRWENPVEFCDANIVCKRTPKPSPHD